MPATTHITPLYAALFALLFFAVSVRTILLRRRLKIAVGDGGQPQMLRAMRVHSNFAEYVPLTLLLVLMLEWQGGHAALIHAFCLVLLVGRLSHAVGVSQVAENYRYRVFGMGSTFTAMVGSAACILGLAVWRSVA
jgi:uncharacterized membrane protein YecN with MAPEG domain